MELPDLSLLNEIDTEYRDLVVSLNESYRGNWDDYVHDSYMQYVKIIQNNSERFHNVYLNTKQIVYDTTTLNVEKYCDQAKTLSKEVGTI